MKPRPDEFELIERYFAPLSGHGSFGLRDDAAILEVPKGRKLVVTNDAVAESVHFLPDTDAKLLAQKALRVNLSDLAAKGATPFAFSMALGLREDWDEEWIRGFARGLKADCRQYGLSLAGGDTFRSPAGFVIAITAYGHVSAGGYASRLGARVGDGLYVTGTIGDSAAGLRIAMTGNAADPAEKFLLGRYLLPQPRTELAPVVERYASAAMDISDGFVGDLEKLCRASGVAISLKAQDVPLSRQVKRWLAQGRGKGRGRLQDLLTGGDDYELLIAVPAGKRKAFEGACAKAGQAVVALGAFSGWTKGRNTSPVTMLDADGAPMSFEASSYNHFRG